MKKLWIKLGGIALVLVLAMVFFACEGPQGPAGTSGWQEPPPGGSVGEGIGMILGGRIRSVNGENTLTITNGQTTFIVANALPHAGVPIFWHNSNQDVITIDEVDRTGIVPFSSSPSVWTGPHSALEISAVGVGESQITVSTIGANAVTEIITVTVVAPAVSSFDYEADIIVVGMGAAGTMAALAPARIWPGVRVIALEADYQVQNSVIRSMGGMNSATITLNPGGRINFNHGLPLFNADGTVSVTRGAMNAGTAWPAGLNTTTTPPATVTRDFAPFSRLRFIETANRLPKMDTLREAAAYSHWMRTVFMPELGLQVAGTGANWAADGAGAGAVGGFRRFQRVFGLAAAPAGIAPLALNPTYEAHSDHVNLMMRTRGEELIVENGRIVGVRARRLDTNQIIEIGADKVILATGNFLRDHELIAQYADPWVNHQNLRRFAEGGWLSAGSATMNEGFGHRMARAVGAASYPEPYFGFGNSYICESFALRLPSTPANDQQGFFKSRLFNAPAQFQMGAPSGGLILVDADGQRFFDENHGHGYGMAGGGINLIGPVLLNHNNFPYHIIISSDTNAALNWNSNVGWNYGGVARSANPMAALNAAADLSGQTEVLRANTLSDLGTLMGLTGAAHANFLATVNAYDAAIGAGEPDPVFSGRAADRRVRRFRAGDGPFFAVKIYPVTAMGTGGVAANWRGRALTQWDNPNSYIENLYTVGEMSFRGLYQGGYPAGSGIGWSAARGMIAGMDAAFRLFWDSEIPALQAPAP
ncbi:MAG: FAD-binding protein [Treponema sp.]|nr:FAD-binding protein [Treponema sp.]